MSRQSIDCTTTSIVDDHAQPGGVLTGHPPRVLESGKHPEIDILFSSTTHEVDWYVMNDPAFDPGTIDNIVDVFASRGRIPRSRARRIVAAYDVNGRTPIEVRGALYTDYSFTLPAAPMRPSRTLPQAARPACLRVGPVKGAPAVHGTEIYGIVGQERPGAGEEQIVRETFVRDTVLAHAEGNIDDMWEAVTAEPTTKGIGNPPYDPTAHGVHVLNTFERIERI